MIKNIVSPKTISRRSRQRLYEIRDLLGLHTLEQTIEFIAHHMDDARRELESFHW